MSAAQALSVARAAGIHLEVDGDDLLLEASSPPPADVLDLLTRHKADVLRMLRPAEDGWSAEDWQALYGERAGHFEFDCGLSRTSAEERAFEACIIDWLNRNPARSPAGRCVWCGHAETRDAVVLPYGIEPGTHAWLHAECWPAWHEFRRFQAKEVLARMGILADACSIRGGRSPSKDAPHQPRTQNV
jgi:hypothetical protein